MPTVADILRTKGTIVHTVDASATVLSAVHDMNQKRIGAVLVMQQGQVAGILSERDILTRVVAEQKDPRTMLVGEAMTREVLFCDPGSDLDDVAELIRARRIRHLPVRDGQDRIAGIISIGDINAYHVQAKQATIENLSDYICGRS